MHYDLIGDIHGHADYLERLLKKLDYVAHKGIYKHSERKVIFLGDYIDRGPRIRDSLRIVRDMVESGNALAIMGNHEYNAICYCTDGPNGQPLREHSDKNKRQFEETLAAFASYKDEWQSYLGWMQRLPLYLELDGLRAVHACWSNDRIHLLRGILDHDRLTDTTLRRSADNTDHLFDVIEVVLKGKELPLPGGYSFNDKGGHPRREVRIKWWLDPMGHTYETLKVNPEYKVPDVAVDDTHPLLSDVYQSHDPPVFFGHYWLKGEPQLMTANACCLDYSVAKGGVLAAYRYDGEQQLDASKLVWVD